MAVSLTRVAGRVRGIPDPETSTLVPDGPSGLTAYIYHQGPREKSPECCRCAASSHTCPASTSRTAGSLPASRRPWWPPGPGTGTRSPAGGSDIPQAAAAGPGAIRHASISSSKRARRPARAPSWTSRTANARRRVSCRAAGVHSRRGLQDSLRRGSHPQGVCVLARDHYILQA
jgi:hypothetical protein